MWSRQLGIDPGGTAFHADEILVADVNLPWPKPVWHKDGFGKVPGWVSAAIVTSHHREPGSPVLIGIRHEVEHDSVPDLLHKLLTRGLGSSPSTVASPRPFPQRRRCCRGWSGVTPGPTQMAERAVMAEIDDWSFDLSARRVEIVAGRKLAVMTCGAPGGLPAKPGREWTVVSVERIC